MKFEETLPRGFRGEFIQRCGRMDEGWMGSDHKMSSEFFYRMLSFIRRIKIIQ